MNHKMKYICPILLLLFLNNSKLFSQVNDPAIKPLIGFVENKGQILDNNQNACNEIIAEFKLNDVAVYVSKNKISYVFRQIKSSPTIKIKSFNNIDADESRNENVFLNRTDLELIGSNPQPTFSLENKSGSVTHYVMSSLASQVITAETFSKILIYNVYPGIDWQIQLVTENIDGKDAVTLKHEFIVHPNADINQIRIQYSGADKTFINNNGELISSNSIGKIVEDTPVSFSDGKNIATKFIADGKSFGFYVSDYNHSKDLVVDPNSVWATYLGGSGEDVCRAVTVDHSGNIFLVGFTKSTNFPTANGYSNTYVNNFDAYMMKFDAAGNRIWGTYYGGAGSDAGRGVAYDAQGNTYYSIQTESNNMPLFSPVQSTMSGLSDMFFVKLNSTGFPVWSTYMGGSGDEFPRKLKIDHQGKLLVIGWTSSNNFPVTNGSNQSVSGGANDAIVMKLNGSTGALLWATYLGGNGNEEGVGVATDNYNNVYVTGTTYSANFPTLNAAQNSYGGLGDFWVAKYNNFGAKQWCTYLGGTAIDDAFVCSTDSLGNCYVTGESESVDFPVLLAYQSTRVAGKDATVTCYSTNGILKWSSYIGGNGNDQGRSIDSDENGNTVIGGFTTSSNFPLLLPTQTTNAGGIDLFITRFDKNGHLLFSTYWGGSGDEQARSLSIDHGNGNVVIVGSSNSLNLPVSAGAFQPNFASLATTENDAFILKYKYCMYSPVIAVSGSNTLCGAQDTVHLYMTNNLSNAVWSNGNTGSTCNAVTNGNYFVTADDSSGCTSSSQPVSVVLGVLYSYLTVTESFNHCSTDSAKLIGIAAPGVNYLWTGPGGFTSTLQSPDISVLNTYGSGTYIETISDGVCTKVVKQITQNFLPTPQGNISFVSKTALCFPGDSLQLSAPAGYTFQWNNGQTTPNIFVHQTGSYGVTISGGGYLCSTTLQNVQVNISDLNNYNLSSGTIDLCSGNSFSFGSPSVLNATYNWTGPNGYTSTLSNPTFTNLITSNSGNYNETVFADGCVKTITNNTLFVHQTPAPPTITGGAPVCEGGVIHLIQNSVTGGVYSWTGPLSFLSSDRAPIIYNVNPNNSGDYFASVTKNGCTSSSSSVNVVVDALPAVPSVSPDWILCGVNNSAVLSGSIPTIGNPVWTLFSGNATIQTPNANSTNANNIADGINIFRYTIQNGTCSVYKDVSINKTSQPNFGCVLPANLTSVVGVSNALLSWSNCTTADFFDVRIYSSTLSKKAKVTVYSKNFTGLTPGVYHWKIRSKCGATYSPYTPEQTLTIAGPRLENPQTEISDVPELKLFPNPASGVCNVSWFENENQLAAIEVYDITGKLVNHFAISSHSGENTFQFNCSELFSGIYLVQYHSASQTDVSKLTVTH